MVKRATPRCSLDEDRNHEPCPSLMLVPEAPNVRRRGMATRPRIVILLDKRHCPGLL